MANKIILKKSSVAAKVPLSTDLEVGEISVNLQDQKLYSKKSDGTVILVGSGLGGAGDVVGAVSSTDDALVRFNGTNGKTIQNSSVTLDDNGNFNNVNAVGFDTTPGTLPTATGSMFWDTGNGTPSIILDSDVTLQLGQEQLALVYNGTGATITNGSLVAVTGAQGARPSVALADADSEALSASTLGIATENILNGAEGFVTTFGFVRGLDTSAFTAGAPIYLSQTAGAFTATRPSAPAHTVAIGWVIKVSASAGEIFVNINNGWELGELHDVLISSVANNEALIYNSASSTWKNTALKTINSTSLIGSGNISIDPIPTGAVMVFAMASAPTGWTQTITDVADNRMLRVVKTAGGGTGGSSSPILNNVVPAHTHGFTTGGQSADHGHSGSTGGISANHVHNARWLQAFGGGDTGWTGNLGIYGGINTGTVSSDHVHGFSTGGVSANHSHSGTTDNGSSQTNWTPRYIDLILCTKN